MQNLGHCVLEVPGEPPGPKQTPSTISQHLWCSFLHTLSQPEKQMGETRPSPDGPAPTPEGRCASVPKGLPQRNMHVAPRWTQGRQEGHPPMPPRESCLPRPLPCLRLLWGCSLPKHWPRACWPPCLHAVTPQGWTPHATPQGLSLQRGCARPLLPFGQAPPPQTILLPRSVPAAQNPKSLLFSLHSSFLSPPHLPLQPKEAGISYGNFSPSSLRSDKMTGNETKLYGKHHALLFHWL